MTDSTQINGDVYVSPRYLAGLSGHSDCSFDPVAHWPHYHLDAGPCQLVIVSPDHRIKIGWFGDDYDIWQVSAAADAVSQARWSARINQNTPPEIVHGLTSALAAEWDEDSVSFLTNPSLNWADALRPLRDAGWERKPLQRGVLEIVSPDGLAGASIDIVSSGPHAEPVTLWAGPPGWGTRAEVIFSARTPKHLIAATAAAFAAPTPVARYRNDLNPQLAKLAHLTPVQPPRPATPTPLDLQRSTAARHTPALGTRSASRGSTTTLPPAPAGPPPARHR
ncbi:DUF317 domain-containing protein [Streptomyces pinistramenti]|uniref:DUF317 domain-containing protein n=1 Tax=Streptomyces pinistramenti TaxID=2884812 RepID=UPI001D098D92|nr:DUF317 domain-containing protein [Streptomyces pinistramenti]MCB5905882.1 DUF317 domain-containing protein [Streptomyces pinistramenti]